MHHSTAHKEGSWGGSLPHEVRHDVHGQWEDDGGVLLCCDGVESLQVAQLQGRRGLGDHEGGLLQSTGCVHLTLGGDHLQGDTGRARWWVDRAGLLPGSVMSVYTHLSSGFSCRLRLGSHGSLELMRQFYVFNLHTLHLDAPVVRGLVQVGLKMFINPFYQFLTVIDGCCLDPRSSGFFWMVYLHAVSDAFAVRQELGQVLRAQDIPEGCLSQQAGGEVSIDHVGHGGDGIADTEVHHTIHGDCYRIFGQDLR